MNFLLWEITWALISCMWMYMKYSNRVVSYNFMCWINLSRCSDFWLSGSSSKWRHCNVHSETMIYLLLEATWKLFSCMWMYIKYWKIALPYNLDVLNAFIKVFWLLVEWKLTKMESHYIIHSGNMIFLLLWSYLESCRCICLIPKESGFLQFWHAEFN